MYWTVTMISHSQSCGYKGRSKKVFQSIEVLRFFEKHHICFKDWHIWLIPISFTSMVWGLSLANCLTCMSLCLYIWWCDYDSVVITEKPVFWQGCETVCLIGFHAITVWRTSECMTWDSTDVFENELKTYRLVDIPNVYWRPIILAWTHKI